MAGPKGSKYYDVFLDYEIFLKNRNVGFEVLKHEHFLLLMCVEEVGSLSSASEKLGMSYRKAWDLVKQSEETLGFPLIEKHRGGREGGSSQLTTEGKTLIDAYRALRQEFDNAAKRIVKDFFQTING